MNSAESAHREAISASRRWVVKIGSALATREGQGLNLEAIADWAAQIAEVRAAGRDAGGRRAQPTAAAAIPEA